MTSAPTIMIARFFSRCSLWNPALPRRTGRAARSSIGTHLHGKFYFDPKGGRSGKVDYSLALMLEDDFSFHQRQQRAWRLDAVNLEKGILTVTGLSLARQTPDAKPTLFKVNPATRVWLGRGFGTPYESHARPVAPAEPDRGHPQGTGRCTDLWLDEESRQLARAQQNEVHRAYEKAHGLPGWIDAVDNEQSLLHVTLFAGLIRR